MTGLSTLPRDLFSPDPAALRAEALRLPAWDLTPRQVADLELLMTGALAPLRGYLGRADFGSVCERMRLADGALWPVPFVLDVTEAAAAAGTGSASGSAVEQRLALRHPEGMILAVLTVSDVWRPDWAAAARALCGTDEGEAAPEAFRWLHETHPVCLGGAVAAIELPPHHAFAGLRLTPAAVRERSAERHWRRTAVYDSFGFPQRVLIEAARRAAWAAEAGLLVRPIDPPRSFEDAEAYAQLRAHERVLSRYPESAFTMASLPLASRASAGREMLLRALIHRNCGCSVFLAEPCAGRAGGLAPDGSAGGPRERVMVSQPGAAVPHVSEPGAAVPHASQPGATHPLVLLLRHAEEIGIEVRVLGASADVPEELGLAGAPADAALCLTPAEIARRLGAGEELPEGAAYPEVLDELRRLHPPRARQGFTVFFTGLSGSGKSTVAQALVAHLLERGDRRVTLLDGDLVRKHLSSELTFSREHRDLNILRIGFVATEVTRHGGVAVCAPIAPYAAVRRRVREAVERVGGFVEVYVATPIAVCEARDRKGLYAKARAGLLKQFTGVDDPYEAPTHAEIVLDTTGIAPDEAAGRILAYLERKGFLEG